MRFPGSRVRSSTRILTTHFLVATSLLSGIDPWNRSLVAILLPLGIACGILLSGCGPTDVADVDPEVGETIATSVQDQASGEAGQEPPVPAPSRERLSGASIAGLVSGNSDQVDDPNRDGWTTEVFGAEVQNALKKLTESLENGERPAETTLKLIAGDFSCSPFPAGPLERSEQTGGIVVERLAAPEPEQQGPLAGPQGFVDALDSLRSMLSTGSPGRRNVKTVRLTLDGEDGPRSTSRIELVAVGSDSSDQITLLVEAAWRFEGDAIRLTGIRQLELEHVRYESPHHPTWFADATASLLANASAAAGQLRYSDDHWARVLEKYLGTNFMGYHGIAVGDLSGDGLDDLYICQSGGIPNLLLVQEPDGTLRDAGRKSGVDLYDGSNSALIVDFDNDGDQDLAIATLTGLLLYENRGDLSFAFRSRIRQARLVYSMAAADFDQDQNLDLYACRYHPPASAAIGKPVPYHNAKNGPRNVLLKNDGNWNFRDVTSEVGLDESNTRWSYAASWGDYDNDGDPDLYVANDFGRNCLYRNDRGRFADIAAEAGVEDVASGMSVTWGDYNRDGWDDLYVSNMFSSAGGRVTFQRNFKADSEANVRADLQRLARGNTLFENRGDGTFSDSTLAAGVEMGRWAWSSNFVDFNNDGWEDLIVANGNYTGEDTGDL